MVSSSGDRTTQPSSTHLTRSLSAAETWGFGFTGHLVWPSVATAIHAALGSAAIFVWFPAILVGMLTIRQVKQLGRHWLDVAGGTPSYTAKLLNPYPGIARYAALGYFFSWVSTLPISAIVLTDLIQVNLEAIGLPCPELPLKLGFTLIAFVLAFSGTRALSILHLFFVLPAIAFLLAFCIQGIIWLAFSPTSPSFFPTNFSNLSFIDWAKWYFFASYAAYACETVSAYVADSRSPKQTLRFLPISAGLMPPIFLGGTWVLTRLATEGNSDLFVSFVAAANPFWGSLTPLIVTFLIAAVSLLSCATVVSNCPRILYQLARDGHLSPVFAVVSKRGVFGPGLLLVLVFSLLCLVWGDVAQIVAVSNVGWFTSFMGLRLGLWLQRGKPEILFPRLSLGILLIEVVILLVGGISWGWREFLIGFLFPIGVLIVDRIIRRVSLAPFHQNWWIQQYRKRPSAIVKDSILLQVVVLIVLLCAAVIAGWSFHVLLNQGSFQNANSLVVVLLHVVVFVGVAIACWTTLPQFLALGEARDAAEHLFNIAQDAIVVVDEMGIIQRVNPAAESLFQVQHNQLLHCHLSQLLPNLEIYPQNWIDRSEHRLTYTNNSEPITIEVSVSDRSLQDCQEYVVILRDISDQKLAETKIRDSYNLLNGVINGTSDLIFVKNLQGQHILINSAYIKVVGKPAEQVKNQTDLVIFPPDIAHKIMEFDQNIMVSGIPKTFEEYVPIQGEMRTFLTTKTPLRDVQGNVVGLIGIARDISDRKLAEEALQQSEARLRQQAQQLQQTLQELQQTQAQLIQTERMSSLGQLVAGVAHEINNPVNFISGNINYAREYIQDLLDLLTMYQQHYPTPASEIQDLAEAIEFEFLKEDLPKLLASMKVGTERIQKIVLALRNFSRMDESEVKEVDIHEGIDNTLMILQNRFKERAGYPGINVIKEYGDLPLIECYAGQLNQVFMNIISNAIDALESLDMNQQLAQPLIIRICTKRLESDRILIQIADNGPGMSENVKKRLFDPFFTTKPVGKGTGLGMSISYQIITEKHRGSFQCNSSLGKGAEFLIEIPIRQSKLRTLSATS